jgi:hypothetical protein
MAQLRKSKTKGVKKGDPAPVKGLPSKETDIGRLLPSNLKRPGYQTLISAFYLQPKNFPRPKNWESCMRKVLRKPIILKGS